MAIRFPQFLSIVFIYLIVAYSDEDPTIKTIEQFSGYTISQSCSPHSLSVQIQSLQQQIVELAGFSDTPPPSVTRILYSENDVKARRYVKNLMGLAGLSVREDAIGNIFGRWDGHEPELPPIATGSHIDAIPYSGKYDGVVGVLGAIEAINVLRRVSPMGMIFIPCYKGYSHKPEEYASGEDIANGVKVLALTLAKLSLK